ncbi:MAG: hypothetical protein KDA86_18280 [Planctomycetaceae bacterium]|nr:hypothetical protein [Planctomycetaceae bacterium]
MLHVTHFIMGALMMVLAFSLCSIWVEPVFAQSSSVKQLDREAEKARMDYLKQLGKLAKQYEEAGDTERSKNVLRQILDLAPDVEEAKSMLKELEERVFEEQTEQIEVDVTQSWSPTGLMLEKDKPVRLKAEGTYKFIVNSSVGPDGFPTSDLDRNLVPGINTGALMGLIVELPKPNSEQKPKPGTPFLIGAESELTPEISGLLYVRVNVPTGSSSNGKLKVKLSGHVTRATASP